MARLAPGVADEAIPDRVRKAQGKVVEMIRETGPIASNVVQKKS
jgi:hypothetical protein